MKLQDFIEVSDRKSSDGEVYPRANINHLFSYGCVEGRGRICSIYTL
jgi:hypothetical protein